MYDFESFLDNPTGSESVGKLPIVAVEPVDELAELINNPHTYVRRKVRFQVNDCLWLEDLRAHYAMLQERSVYRDKSMNRCITCTLPLGTCPHSENWEASCGPASASSKTRSGLAARTEERDDEKNKPFSPVKDIVSNEMDDLFDILSGGVRIATSAQKDDVDIERIRWYQFQPRLSDKIGDTYLSLSVPPPRGWHSMISMGRFLVLYGGFRFLKNKLPQPFISATKHDDIEYLSDIYIYDSENLSWHSPCPAGPVPPGRYGHAAFALDGKRMAIFGGRGQGGRFYQDTWVFDISLNAWSGPMFGDKITPAPSPRCFCGYASVTDDNHTTNGAARAFIFGGTDGVENYGDLWILHVKSRESPLSEMKWERAMAVGPTPHPKYGHRMVRIGGDLIAVIGGCSVSPQSELSSAGSDAEETRRLFGASSALIAAYKAEVDVPSLAGRALAQSQSHNDLLGMHRQASVIAGTTQYLESETRKHEVDLTDLFYKSEAKKKFLASKAKHPHPHLDISFLNTRDLTWTSIVPIGSKDTMPCSRMHFSAAYVGNYLLLIGGTAPTSLSFGPVDTDYSRTFALDTRTLRWIEPRPVDTSNYFDEPIQIAESDIIRARRRCEDEKARGMSNGVKNGETPELAEAEAVLDICKWRRRMLEKEKSEFRPPPSSRWGHSLCVLGQRAILLGGWGAELICKKDESFVIDLEPELERNRRLEDEFEARLERERLAEESSNIADSVSSAYEIRARLAAEKADQAMERERMAIEEIRCCVPPISKPSPVRLVKASHNTIWLEWDPVYKNSNGDILDSAALAKVTYFVWSKDGYQRLLEGDRVIVKVPVAASGDGSRGSRPTATHNQVEDLGQLTDDESDEENGELRGSVVERFKDFHGEIATARVTGLFDIAYDDGTIQKYIPRSRIRLESYLEPRREPISALAITKSKERHQFRDRFGRKHRERTEKLSEDARLLATRAAKLGLSLRPKKMWKDTSHATNILSKSFDTNTPLPTFKRTVTVGPEWQLLYAGPDLAYACTGLVPDVALAREWPENRPRTGHLASAPVIPTAKASVTFCLQVSGIDYPIEEHSLLSDPVTLTTRPMEGNVCSPLDYTNSLNYTVDAVVDEDMTVATMGDTQSLASSTTAATASTNISKVKQQKFSTTVYVVEDDVRDKYILLRPNASSVTFFERESKLGLQLDDEWTAENTAVRRRRVVKSDVEDMMGSRIRAAVISITKVGMDTVMAQGIAHEYI